MLKVFGIAAALWAAALVVLLGVAVHHVLAHLFTFVWLTAVFVSAPFAWRWLEQYKVTAGIAAKIDAAETTLWGRLRLHVAAGAHAILLSLVSAWAAGWDWLETTLHTLFGLQPGDLDPFKDVTLLHTFFSNDIVPKVVAAVTWFGVILHLKQVRDAAAAEPVKAAPATPAAAS